MSEMRARVDEALRMIQTAMFGRKVYGVGHAALLEREASAAALLSAAGNTDRVLVVCANEQVLFGEEPVASSTELARGLFREVQDQGVAWILFEGSVSAQAIGGLVDLIDSRTLADGAGELNSDSGGKIRFGALGTYEWHQDSPAGSSGTTAESVAQVVSEAAQELPDAWNGLVAGDEESGQMLMQMVSSLTTAAVRHQHSLLPLLNLKATDDYTYLHAINVGVLSGGLARAVGLKVDLVREITLCGVLHDVGKQRIPGDVLNNPGRLGGEGLRMIRSHPEIGARMLLDQSHLPPLAAVVAYQHHMNLDGTGYPMRRRGESIHPASQMVHVADVFDALRSSRAYREALPQAKVMQIMLEDAGPRMDADLVRIFFEKVVPEVTATALDRDAA